MPSVGIGVAITTWVLMWWVGSTELAGEGSPIAGSALLSLASLAALLVVSSTVNSLSTSVTSAVSPANSPELVSEPLCSVVWTES